MYMISNPVKKKTNKHSIVYIKCISQKSTQRLGKQTYCYQRGNIVGGRGLSGAWDEFTHAPLYIGR